jgi:acyl transferase domain-containing protein/acyl carrier protein
MTKNDSAGIGADDPALKSSLNPHLGSRPEKEPIAIIGIGCRFAGAASPMAFWQMLRGGVDAIRPLPEGRFDLDAVYDPTPGKPGKIISREGGFIDPVDEFDATFFGISPREARRLDPQQRLLLEVAWEALEDAGQVPANLAESRTGVFIGACSSDFEDIQYYLRDRTEIDFYVATGTARAVISGRLSYMFDLRGPSLTVDTACSSSLVAVHLACNSLWGGESSLALAGGVNLILLPEMTMSFSRAKMLAADSRCKFADSRADGFVRSDGVGVVVLKPLSLAQADNDPIYAVIRGTAVNNDGRGNGLLTTPSQRGHEAVLREAYLNAGVSPGSVKYVEVHGTGTSVGDPIEVRSLGAVLSEGRAEGDACLIGSVKSNIGHTEGAAGVAGLIKAALCLKHRAVPPSLHLERPNPSIPWDEIPLKVVREFTTFAENSGPVVAGVSSFGISATNAHVVLEERPSALTPAGESAPSEDAHLLTLSAPNQEALDSVVRSYIEFTKGASEDIGDVCYSTNVRRSHHSHRLALVVSSYEEMADKLAAYLRMETRAGMSSGEKLDGSQPRIVFVFPGQGTQWTGMGRTLFESEPVFRAAIERCEKAIMRHADWSLTGELMADEWRSRLSEIHVVQPCLFAIQVALAELWRSWGVVPDAIAGQSMGEVAAAHVAGALSLEDAAKLICRRSLLLNRIKGKGAMCVVGLSFDETQRILAGYEEHVSIAVSSSPTSTVISGDTACVEEVMALLHGRDVFCQAIKVDAASHSPQVDCLREELLRSLDGITPKPALVPIYSTVTAGPSDDLSFDAEYWVRNLREPVLFSAAVERLLKDNHNIFLEVSPHPALLGSIQQSLRHHGREGLTVASLRRDESERAAMLASLGAIHAVGYTVDWIKTHRRKGNCVQLPSYPWQRERFPLGLSDTAAGRVESRSASRIKSASHHLLSDPAIRSAAHPGTYIWDIELGADQFPYLKDHCVQGIIVFPAAAYIEMALAAAKEIFGDGSHALENLSFKKALHLDPAGPRQIQFVVTPEGFGRAAFQFFSLRDGGGQHAWDLHAWGTILDVNSQAAPPQNLSPESIQSRCEEYLSQSEHYRELADRGLQYGASFRGVEHLWRRDGEAIALISIRNDSSTNSGKYVIHPALLDACFQALAAALPRDTAQTGRPRMYLPADLDSLRIYAAPGAVAWSYATLQPDARAGAETLKGDVFLLDERGQFVAEARGLGMRRRGNDTHDEADQNLVDWLYEISWKPEALRESPGAFRREEDKGAWVIFIDEMGVGLALAESLESSGEPCLMVTRGESFKSLAANHCQMNAALAEDYDRLWEKVFAKHGPRCRGVVHLWSLDVARSNEISLRELEAAHDLGCNSVLLLMQSLFRSNQNYSTRLWLVTNGAQAVGARAAQISIAQSPLWGMGRVISNEHPEVRCTMVDLDANAESSHAQFLLRELWSDSEGEQIAYRDGARFVARLVRYDEKAQARISPHHPLYGGVRRDENHAAFYLESPTPGVLDDLRLRATTRKKPGPGEVEIQVCAVGLNFRDVMLAMGVLPSAPGAIEPLGWECAGKIVSVGEGVDDFRPGGEVVAIAPGCFGSYAIAKATLVVRKPARLSFEEAATLPIAFVTAHYCLRRLARIARGERVLIHAASGGVGLAAVWVARRAGAEVFATAGSDEKRDFLRARGVEHVFDSRSLSFADEIMRATGGEGVDVVLNSLAGEAIPAGLSVLREGGRFIELGRRDIYGNTQLGLRPFQQNLSFFAFDLARLIERQPSIGGVFREVIDESICDAQAALPYQAFPIADVVSAFRLKAQAKHVGKIVITMHGEGLEVGPAAQDLTRLSAEATYLITGGAGGLGLKVAEKMVEQGARHLVLMTRGVISPAAQRAVDGLRQAAEVVVAKADVSNRKQVANLIDSIRTTMPPLRGVIHAAGLLDDGILLQLTPERFKKVMDPKIRGAWNLHTLTLDMPLDFFVMFSSAASVLGSPGQANYSAANAFLDALAHDRRARGLAALSINWGPWSEVGLAAQAGRHERLLLRGVGNMTPAQGVRAFSRLLGRSAAQVAVMPFDYKQWNRNHSHARNSPLFSELDEEVRTDAAPGKGIAFKQELLLAGERRARRKLLQSYLGELMAKVLGLSASRLSKLDVNQPINSLGVDSLMAVELKTLIEADLGVTVPVTSFLQSSTLSQLADDVLSRLALLDADSNPPASLVEVAPAEDENGPLAEVSSKTLGSDHWEELSL